MSNKVKIYKKIFPFIFGVTSLFSTDFSYADAIPLYQEVNLESIKKNIEYLEDKSARLTIQDITSNDFVDRFKKTNDLDFGYTHSAFWLRFTLVNKTDNINSWYLWQNFANINYFSLYEPVGDGLKYRVKRSGNLLAAEQRDVIDRHPTFQLTLRPGEVKTYYLYAKSEGSMHFDVRILSADNYAQYVKKDYLLYGAYYGVLLVMFFYNAIIYYFLRDDAYKWLITYIAAVLFGSLVYHGFIQLILDEEVVRYGNLGISLVVPILGISLLKFTEKFLEPSGVSEPIKRVNRALLILTLLEFLLLPVSNVETMYIVGPIFNFTLLFCLYRLLYAYKQNVSSARWYALSWLVMLVSITLVSLSNYNLIPVNRVTANSYLFGVTWMVLFMSVALADRVNKLRISAEQSQHALNESESQRQMIMRAGKLGLWMWDIKNRKINWSEETEAIFGLKEGLFTGSYRQFLSLAHPDDISYLKQSVKSTIENRSPFYVEYRIIQPNGVHRWLGAYGKLDLDDKAQPIRMSGTVQDITEFKQTKEELRDSEQNYHHLFQSAADGFVIISMDGKAVDANPAAYRMFGYNKDEFLRLPINTLFHPDSIEFSIHLQDSLKNDKSYYSDEAIGLKRDGTQFYIQIKANIMKYQGQPHGFMVLRDISKQKKLQGALKLIASGVADNTGILFFQHLVLQLAQVYQAKYSLIGTFVKENDSHYEEFKSLAFCRYGKIVEPVSFNVPGSLYESSSASNMRVYSKNVRQNFPQDGFLANLKAESLIAVQLTNSKGRPIGALLVIDDRPRVDIDELGEIMQIFAARAAAEIERMLADDLLKKGNIQLEQLVAARTAELSAVNQELESFSYSVSHDLRAPLRAIAGYSSLIVEELHDHLNEELESYIGNIKRNTLHMGQLIDDLLQLSRVTRKDIVYKDINLSKLVSDSVNRCREREPRQDVNVSIEPNLWAQGDLGLMSIAIDNLVSNAWKYTRNTKHASLEFGALVTQDKLSYFIKDNGAGFDPKYAGKLFNAFHRLHRADEYEGTGIGLATVARIIHRHGGHIWAEADIEKGATFFFDLHTTSVKQIPLNIEM